jgi:hypothetical protein
MIEITNTDDNVEDNYEQNYNADKEKTFKDNSSLYIPSKRLAGICGFNTTCTVHYTTDCSVVGN